MTGPGRPLKGRQRKVAITVSVDPEVIDSLKSQNLRNMHFNVSDFVNTALRVLIETRGDSTYLSALEAEIRSHSETLEKLGERRNEMIRNGRKLDSENGEDGI
jgi:Arc/MetJ-type ribon-helix-helix transcriptional regulator